MHFFKTFRDSISTFYIINGIIECRAGNHKNRAPIITKEDVTNNDTLKTTDKTKKKTWKNGSSSENSKWTKPEAKNMWQNEEKPMQPISLMEMTRMISAARWQKVWVFHQAWQNHPQKHLLMNVFGWIPFSNFAGTNTMFEIIKNWYLKLDLNFWNWICIWFSYDLKFYFRMTVYRLK